MLEINKIYCGDCLELMQEISDKSIDLVITDPPYGLNYRSNRGAKTGNLKDYISNDKFTDYIILLEEIRKSFDRIMADNSEAYVFCGGGGEPVLAYAWLEFKEAKRFKVKNLLVWDKEYVGMGWDWRFQYETIFQLQCGNGLNNNIEGSNRANILKCKNVIPQAGEHPTEKPIELIKQILKAKPSEIVLDPFLGSGTTAVACKSLGRDFIGIEINPKYCEIAEKRLKNVQMEMFV
jgi:site-specific DNA-methyltransferase (adenine-specific)